MAGRFIALNPTSIRGASRLVRLDAAIGVATPRTDRAGTLVSRTVLVSIPWGSETPENQGG
jgi:hypothetical protein